jgi:hypothetical protein
MPLAGLSFFIMKIAVDGMSLNKAMCHWREGMLLGQMQ